MLSETHVCTQNKTLCGPISSQPSHQQQIVHFSLPFFKGIQLFNIRCSPFKHVEIFLGMKVCSFLKAKWRAFSHNHYCLHHRSCGAVCCVDYKNLFEHHCAYKQVQYWRTFTCRCYCHKSVWTYKTHTFYAGTGKRGYSELTFFFFLHACYTTEVMH